MSKRTNTALNRDFTEQVNAQTEHLGQAIASLSELTEANTIYAEHDGVLYRIAPVDSPKKPEQTVKLTVDVSKFASAAQDEQQAFSTLKALSAIGHRRNTGRS